jgi:hypothetical protein
MPSKQKEAQVAERLGVSRLNASIAGTGHEVTSGFHMTQAQLEAQKNQKEWDALRAEEADQLEAQRKNSKPFKFQTEQWSRPIETLKATRGLLLPDVAANLPITDRAMDTAKIQTAYEDLLSVMQTRGQVLSASGKQRFLLYVSVQAGATQVTDGKEYRLAADDINCLIACLNRMIDLGAFESDEYAALLEDDSQPEPIEQSADDLRELAEEEWSRFPLWHSWEQSLESGFGIKLTDSYRRIVCGEFERANLSPYAAESYNEICRRLVARERFPTRPSGEPALTVDERMAALTENYDLRNPVQKRAWCHEIGRLRSVLGE